ncbi:GGDEF-domain containing protein, partial [Staphylococcus haemolyticus]
YLFWRNEGLPCVPIAVNVSSVQFKRKGLVDYLVRMLAAYGLDSTAIQVELTETALMDDIDHAVKVLGALKELGIRISLDDFGTGYSNLARLRELPVDRVKIDRSLVRDIATSAEARTICSAVVGLIQGLGMEVVIEGVETQAQMEMLRVIGCTLFQGYHLARPTAEQAYLAQFAPQRPTVRDVG